MRPPFPLVSIISINYNSLQDTLEFLESVHRLSYPAIEIILVDNASRENPKEIIQMKFPQDNFNRSGRNLGSGGCNNLGIVASKGQYLLFLNNDTLVVAGFIETLVEFMVDHPDAGMASPKVLFPDGKTIQYAGAIKISALTGRGKRLGLMESDNGEYDRTYKTDLGHGAAMIVPRDVMNRVGLLPEVYFLYYEEHDWCEQIKRHGYSMYYVGTTKILHKESVSTGGDESYLKVYFINRNRLLFMRRNSSGLPLMLGISFFFLISIPKKMSSYLLKGKFNLVKALWNGIYWNLTNFKTG